MVNYCLVVPILQGKVELLKKFEEENGGNSKEHDEFYRIAGVSREQVWVQRSPPGSSGIPDFEIISMETEDPSKTLKEFSTSSHPWAIKFRKFAKEAFGMDISSGPPPPLNELIVDWNEKKY